MTMNAGDAARQIWLCREAPRFSGFVLVTGGRYVHCGRIDDMNEYLKFSEGRILR